jgi:hypothetical protein
MRCEYRNAVLPFALRIRGLNAYIVGWMLTDRISCPFVSGDSDGPIASVPDKYFQLDAK